uniref:Bromo domain-containing protein n=1 Tax=Globisporangium ultimum (strain ATCC 200006 / CBS 805.95 / DAOM BR144) TaxID=431595 RepID=K3WQ51_GLOUD
MAWQTICTFKNFVTLGPLSLEGLVHRMTTKCDEGTDIGLMQIFLAFLRAILAEKSFTSLMDDIVVEGNIKVSDLFVNSERTYGICERPYKDMLNIITWQDILRQLMSKDLGIDASIGHVEPLVGCEVVRQTLYMQTVSAPFNTPVDTSLKGLEDYTQIIKQPMDLGTIKTKLDSGGYEGPQGYERFAADVRLVWENALLYNGEDSEIGRSALGLSDIFEQDYQRFVVGPLRANDDRIEGCKKVKAELQERFAQQTQPSSSYVDIVHALYAFEFHELPISYKVGALSWLCSEFLKLDSIRTYIEAQMEHEVSIVRDHRKRAAELEARRKHAEKVRREKEAAFRKECISQGILPNSQNIFSEAMREKYDFIATFYKEIHLTSASEDGAFDQDKKNQIEEMKAELRAVIVRELPLGKDRYHNCYWVFKNDTCQRLFIEKCDSGHFVICKTSTELHTLLDWLNPKGSREMALLSKLTSLKETLLQNMQETAEGASDEIASKASGDIKVNLFPLPCGDIKQDYLIVNDKEGWLSSHSIVQKMLLSLRKHLTVAGILHDEWDSSTSWSSRVQESKSFNAVRALFAELEDTVVASTTAAETLRLSWQRKRREWRLALEGACTKLKSHSDAGPFLEAVSDRDFPEYKEIVLQPMNFGKMMEKAKTLQYQSASELLADVKLICNNCELFCEGRFPALPPLARNLVEMAEGLVKRSNKDIRACEKSMGNADATLSPEKVVKSPETSGESKEAADKEMSSGDQVDTTKPITAILRLENRLPEYVVDMKREAEFVAAKK